MSDSLPDMTAAPGQFRLGGKTYRVAPLSFRDLGELERFLNAQIPDPRQIAREMIESGLPESICEKIAMEAFRVARSGGVRINDPEAGRILGGAAGAVQVLWLALRKHQPHLTTADVEAIFEAEDFDPAEYEKLQDFVFGNDDDGDGEAAGPKAAGGRAKRGRPTPNGGRSSTR